ncbi:MAG: methylenetetrahydrofolate--tRNA-(uracil(54)-C(5))-methyltransferase (FADH(2)-oxidizing) TrmFO [Desulfomonilia bacterium]|jgi:methylenetetrahydrofolate--tRNA-(uracil-5-)-methyltransferase|uniref:Methylenetetrahydrofolate--tRNA-(Uracil-5-)-methyltransferase TrmFO n=1 Tax=anaerobic digester metagenome TaxID=1263854 RepID=A0A485LWV8_9ZZZZ|nr:methylenetetrahydrofolate--tRNA-(uracil(54)-C(5))-methyltransferase (FADH(2)-oxidizing) TrmFO [Pseudomonadota bacterium]HON37218.1 methylenetetrahydrofolate--tRNA-(uracil(54)-C(5))-methyltransferase (FADH(2)-oxidizing) TrmFO [Deltaproteobacteria bacterium]HRS57111.1 methylenetetrahydrofolate--tRNA-(uracil(54)-C(5))-methyltransferase (FADH(2)-oxidizing) TrmFO [Desulfomonilia bacterium]HPD20024.1 methylenetetrahydrofolate--tRNA-(uracil(54)-C(5))-methyltransferase (FADH(2)-oxidizing) TrmFO [Delt
MKKKDRKVRVIGGGLAGVEAARFLSDRGLIVELFEMRPGKSTPAHKTGLLGELVCSNSLKGTDPQTAHGLLKKEMSRLNSLVLRAARETSVPAGKALAVDRDAFAATLTREIESDERIQVVRREVCEIDPEIPTIVATGPLTSDALAARLADMLGSERMFFYDAISPIVDAQSIDMSRAFFGSRWEEGSADYLNCPLEKDEYDRFVRALLEADRVQAHAFEDARFFDACLPVEVIAGRGSESLRYGPMRPVGMVDPSTGRRPYAVLQLRRENLKGDAYNMVGFQTRLTYPEQKRVFSLIPALSRAVFHRYGSIHRNTYFDSPRVLNRDLSLKGYPRVFLAGQLTGVEGYMESASTGIYAAIGLLSGLKGKELPVPPADTALGALIQYITEPREGRLQPSNINFGIMEASVNIPKKRRSEIRLEREAMSFENWYHSLSGLI